MNFFNLSDTIWLAHTTTCENALKQINLNLTIRNWLIGHLIVEYELKGEDRAAYGQGLYKSLEKSLKAKGIRGLSLTMLHTCKQFYLNYPQIFQSVTEKLQIAGNQASRIFQSLTEKFESEEGPLKKVDSMSPEEKQIDTYSPSPETLLSRLSFTHFVELMRVDRGLKRAFYEIQAIKNNWSVRTLEREIGTHLFERTGMSHNKAQVLAKASDQHPLEPQDIIKDPYMLDFLGAINMEDGSEAELESAILAHLERVLVELGRGFCFEARQKRIVLDNEYFIIDLVFYHRILKCHVLIDIKFRKFSHADASQMNFYINYFREHEMTEGDKDPIGIILCTDKNETMVKYATDGITRDLFVSKYMIELPSLEELKRIVMKDLAKLESATRGE